MVCAFAFLYANAQLCENIYLASIFEKLPYDIKSNGEGEIDGFRVKVEYNPYGVVSTVGVKLPIFEGDTTIISSFVERFFLDLILAQRDLDIKNVLDHSRSKLYFNGAEYQKGPYWNLSNGLSILNRTILFDMRRDSLEYSLEWGDGNNSTLALKFPANIQILTGKDKSELENGIEAQFVKCSEINNPKFESEEEEKYSKLKSGLFARNGVSFLLDSISSTTYYTRKRSNSYEVVYTPDMIAPSLSNLLLMRSEFGDETIIQVEQRMYGNSIKSFEITTNTLRRFCEANELKTYVGVEKVNGDKIEATVLLHNAELNYLHMLHVITDISSLFSSDRKFMSARLFSYIPFDNVTDLFEEYKEPKEKRKLW
ncbi:MAG: hypothetical protein SNG27_01650 [Rikenellaceae bacterium]